MLNYYVAVLPVTQDISEADREIAALSLQASNNPSLFYSSEWKRDFDLYLAALDLDADDLEKLPSAPDEASKLDETVKEIASEVHLFVRQASEGIAVPESGELQAAIRTQSTINDLTAQATQEANELNAELSVQQQNGGR